MNVKTMCALTGVMLAAVASAGDRMPLWEDGKGPSDAALEWAAAPKDPKVGACLLLLPDASPTSGCDAAAFEPLVKKLLANGIDCVWLRPGSAPADDDGTRAWKEGRRAVRLLRREAAARGYSPDRIGVFGGSDGARLALLLATASLTPVEESADALDKTSCRVNVALAASPTGILTGGEGTNAVLDARLKFDRLTCPTCLFHGADDPATPIASTRVYRELRKARAGSDLHIDMGRGAGLPTADGFERGLEFLRQIEFVGKLDRPSETLLRVMPHNTLRTEKQKLWPAGKVPDEPDGKRLEPYLVWFVPEKQTTQAIQVVFPGGGYSMCNFNGEALPVAYYLNGKGMTCVVVMYRCRRPAGKPKHYSAWQDAERAIRLVRAAAPARGLDPNRIGVMGFSAGGHLTLMTATNTKTMAYEPVDEIDQLPCSVQWACPIYPAYALTDGPDWPNKQGGNELSDEPVPEFGFDAATPPMCFVHGDADLWAAMNSVVCWERLRRMGVPGEVHTLARRGHCFQVTCSRGTGSYTWLDRLWNFYGKLGMTCEDRRNGQD